MAKWPNLRPRDYDCFIAKLWWIVSLTVINYLLVECGFHDFTKSIRFRDCLFFFWQFFLFTWNTFLISLTLLVFVSVCVDIVSLYWCSCNYPSYNTYAHICLRFKCSASVLRSWSIFCILSVQRRVWSLLLWNNNCKPIFYELNLLIVITSNYYSKPI